MSAPAGGTPPHLTDAYLAGLPRWVAATGGETRAAAAPFTGELLPRLPVSSPADLADAAERGRKAQAAWAAESSAHRARVMIRFGELLLERREELLDLVQWETGKSRVHAAIEHLGVAAVAAYYGANGPGQLREQRTRSGIPGVVRARVARRPKGLVGVVAPWNYPLFLAVGDVIPALVAGNAVISKADSQATLTLLAARAVADEAGLPPDVWAVVAGSGRSLGPALVEAVDHLAFTGSTATGRGLAQDCGRRLIGASLELGGKNPMVVRGDADLKAAVRGAVQACFASAGQMCIGIERIYVHAEVYDEFLARFAAATRRIRMGAAYDFSVEMGTLTNAGQLEATRRHVADAADRGATVVTGGRPRPDLGPFFFEPTILTGVTAGMAVYAEETFGPVVAVHAVSDDDEAVRRANEGSYGLSASIWSRDLAVARELAGRIRAGAVNVNDGYLSAISALAAPMGGMGDSGVGRRHGPDGIWRFTEAQTVTTQRLPTAYPRRPTTWLTASRGMLTTQLRLARRALR
ncbi:succinic semialdehyde dehydrogenase [Nocardioides sp.]|uniref:succinic semialdehyde dehydrogenase n=1 Tax=Nocardioides sp. TaxID=35761 RepID=UPI0027373873|nr:succinic semialdehyde dehydrogenase [Nocardioides sp.]MDP3890728.1 succinic semialdehyde dehydrogenase [Nocardioides sp.]